MSSPSTRDLTYGDTIFGKIQSAHITPYKNKIIHQGVCGVCRVGMVGRVVRAALVCHASDTPYIIDAIPSFRVLFCLDFLSRQ